MSTSLLVMGCGELGLRVASRFVAAGGVAVGLTRTDLRHKELVAHGVTARVSSEEVPSDHDALLISAAGHAAQKGVLDRLRSGQAPRRSVLISSTGYYGWTSGLVSEDTPAAPDGHALALAAVEAEFRDWSGAGGVVLRLAGLYRLGRGPMSALQKSKSPPLGPPEKTLALVHYDDAATAVLAALSAPAPEATYLVVTPPCPTRRDFYHAACVLLDLPTPAFDQDTGRPPTTFDTSRLRRDLLPIARHSRWQEALLHE